VAISLDAVSGTNSFGNSAAAKTVSLSLGSGNNRIVVAGMGINNNSGFSPAPTFNGTTMTAAVSLYNSGYYGGLYYLLDASLPSAGTYSLSVDPVVAGRGGIWCLSLFGVKQVAPEATNSSGGVTSTTLSTSITTLTNNAWLVDFLIDTDVSVAPAGGQTERFDLRDYRVWRSQGRIREARHRRTQCV